MDVVTKEKRSYIMSRVSQRSTPQEILVRKFLFRNGLRYRINYKRLPGSPDIVLPRFKIAIFVNGCFWHGHQCKGTKLPKSNVEFWKSKIEANKQRDKNNISELEQLGWNTIAIWQCQLKTINQQVLTLKNLLEAIVNMGPV